MKTTLTIWLCLLLGLPTLSSCSTDNSENGNTNPVNGVRIKTMTQQEFIGGQWKDTYRTTNTFQGSNLMMSSSLTQKWNTTTSNWVNYNQSLYTLYDSSHASQQIIQNWDATTSSWDNYNRHSFTDNANGNRVRTETETWDHNSWKTSSKADFTYDDNGFLIRSEMYLWNTAETNWNIFPSTRAIYTNNTQGKPTLTETYLGTADTPYTKETATYDGNGFLLTRQGQILSAGNWVIVYLSEQNNLPNGFPSYITQTNYNFDGSVSQQFKFVYEYY